VLNYCVYIIPGNPALFRHPNDVLNYCVYIIPGNPALFRHPNDVLNYITCNINNELSTLVNKICWYCKCGTDRKYTETNNNV
jgi:PhoPQ-activated pathogenicity-related protein